MRRQGGTNRTTQPQQFNFKNNREMNNIQVNDFGMLDSHMGKKDNENRDNQLNMENTTSNSSNVNGVEGRTIENQDGQKTFNNGEQQPSTATGTDVEPGNNAFPSAPASNYNLIRFTFNNFRIDWRTWASLGPKPWTRN